MDQREVEVTDEQADGEEREDVVHRARGADGIGDGDCNAAM